MAIYIFTIQVDFPGTFDGSNFFLSLSNAFPIAMFHEKIRLSLKGYLKGIFFSPFKCEA